MQIIGLTVCREQQKRKKYALTLGAARQARRILISVPLSFQQIRDASLITRTNTKTPHETLCYRFRL